MTRSGLAIRRRFRATAVRIGLSIAALGASAAVCATSDKPVMMTFNDVNPDFSLELYVPDGWTAGRLVDGDRILSREPLLVLFGGIGDRDKRVLGELRYLAKAPEYEPTAVFTEVARQRYGASVAKVKPVGSAGGETLVEYRNQDDRAFIERIAVGQKIALSLFIGTAPNQALLDDINNILVKSKMEPK